jgi:hypothetical protein
MVEQKDFTANAPHAASGDKHLSLRGETARVNEGLARVQHFRKKPALD